MICHVLSVASLIPVEWNGPKRKSIRWNAGLGETYIQISSLSILSYVLFFFQLLALSTPQLFLIYNKE